MSRCFLPFGARIMVGIGVAANDGDVSVSHRIKRISVNSVLEDAAIVVEMESRIGIADRAALRSEFPVGGARANAEAWRGRDAIGGSFFNLRGSRNGGSWKLLEHGLVKARTLFEVHLRR